MMNTGRSRHDRKRVLHRSAHSSLHLWAVLIGAALFLSACENDAPDAQAHTENAPAAAPQPPPADQLEADLRALGQRWADYMTPLGEARRGHLAPEQAWDLSTVLQPGWCYKIIAIGDEGIADLDLRVFDQNNVLRQRDTSHARELVIGNERPICPYEPGQYRLEIRAREGAGEYMLQIYQSL